jgi:hypothetical protein
MQMCYVAAVRNGVAFPAAKIVGDRCRKDDHDYDLDSNHTDVGGR